MHVAFDVSHLTSEPIAIVIGAWMLVTAVVSFLTVSCSRTWDSGAEPFSAQLLIVHNGI
jgi:hypothetical protein